MKIKHYYFFGNEIQNELNADMLNENNWDILRTQGDSAFSIENDIIEYERNCEQAVESKERATVICKILKKYDVNKVVSLGVGKGILEWHIKKQMPEVYMVCTDYASEGIEQLRKVFPTCDEIKKYDMLREDYSIWKGATILMHRISTEFTKQEWKYVFDKMYNGGVNRIIFVPTEILTFRIAFNEIRSHFFNRICGKKDIMCGWMYSKKEFLEMFQKYSIEDEFKESSSEGIFNLIRR